MNPFNQAWLLLKQTRQTTLGEYPGFEDAAFSPYGPVTQYHGTTVGPAAAIGTQGLQPKLPYEAQMTMQQTAAQLQGKPVQGWYPHGVYASNDPQGGAEYARWRSQDRNQAPTMFGIRGGGLDMSRHQGIPYFPNAIPRERLVPIPLNQKTV